jgi:hypothetical protein
MTESLRRIRTLRYNLQYVLDWDRTPKTSDYWREVCKYLELVETRTIMRYWGDYEEYPSDTENVIVRNGRKLSSLVDSTMVWANTPQGGQFWRDLHTYLYSLGGNVPIRSELDQDQDQDQDRGARTVG